MSRTLTTKQQHLAAVPLFAHCNPKQLARIDQLADEVDVPSGHQLITRGKLGHEFFIIQSGAASVRRDDREIATLRAGDSTGELALLGASPLRSADVVTTEPSRVIVLGAREFREMLLEDPLIAIGLLATVAEWLKARLDAE